MSRLLRYVFPLLVVALVIASVLGAWQAISGEEGSEPESPVSDQGARETAEASDQSAVNTVQQFVDSGSSPCKLAVAELLGHPAYQDQYSSLADLINDVDLVLVGHVTGWALEDVRRGTMASAIFAHVEIEEVLAGTVAGTAIDIDLGERVTAFGDDLKRNHRQLDSCASGRLLLFAHRLHGSGFALGAGWVSLDTLEASPIVGVFAGYADAGALLADVRKSVETLEAQGLPKGLLACQGKRLSEAFLAPVGCPGDRLDLSQTFELASVVGAGISTSDPGPGVLSVQSVTLEADSGQLAAILSALDFSAALEPLGPPPPDVISISLKVNVPGQAPREHEFLYSPVDGVVRLTDSQFVAPPALVQAMTPFLAP